MATVTTQERTNILKLVAGMFNAAPGAAYLNEFTNAFVDLNKDLGALANALGQTGAFQSLYPSFLTADEFANKFLDTLGLKANTEAQDWVKAKVNAGESFASVAFQALLAIDASTAAEFKAAKDQLANKAAVAEYYSVEQNKSADDLGTLQNVVATVTNNPATVEAAKQGAAVATGKTFTLTTGIDSVVGTSGNDTIVGDNTTLGASDTIDGGAGIDTLNYTDSSTTGVAPQGIVKNVEIINVRNVNGSAGTAGTKEAATVTFGAVTAGQTVIIGGVTFTDGGTGSTAAQVAAFFSTAPNIPAGYTVTATTGSTVTFTATAVGNQPTNLAVTGTGAATQSIVVVDGTAAVAGSGIALTVNASNFAGATDFNSNLSTNAVNFTNLSAGQKVGLIGNGAAVLGNVTAAYGAGVTATEINVSGGVGPAGTVAPTVTLSGPTVNNTATINSKGTVANTLGGVALGGQATGVTVDAEARLSTGNITGFTGTTASITVKGAAAGTATAAAVNLGTIENTTVKTIDASGLTAGGIAAVLNTNQTITVTGGQGQDIITTGSILTTGSVDAGAGANDRLIVSTTNHIDSTTGKLYKNFEQVQVQDGQTVNLALLAATNTIDTIRIADAGSTTGVTNLTAAQAANVTILSANATGAITIGVKDAEVAGQIDTVKATVVNTNAAGTAGVPADLSAMVLTGVEKLELTGTGTSAATSGQITFTTAAALALDSIKLTTNGAAIVTVDASHAGTNLTIDGSASKGALTLNAAAYAAGSTGAALTGGDGTDILLGATARADKLVGGAGNDVIIAGSGLTGTVNAGTATAIGTIGSVSAIAASSASDILTGGAGKDLFVLGINSAANTISSITDLDLGGATLALGQDQIVLDMANTAAATIYTLSDTQKTAITNAADLGAALDLVAAATNAAANNGVAQFTYGTDTYLFVNSSSTTATYVAGTDAVIKITGVVGTLDASDIVFI